MSIRAIAHRANVSTQTVYRFLHNPGTLTLDTYRKISAAYGYSIHLIQTPLYDPLALLYAEHMFAGEYKGLPPNSLLDWKSLWVPLSREEIIDELATVITPFHSPDAITLRGSISVDELSSYAAHESSHWAILSTSKEKSHIADTALKVLYTDIPERVSLHLTPYLQPAHHPLSTNLLIAHLPPEWEKYIISDEIPHIFTPLIQELLLDSLINYMTTLSS